MSKKMFKNLNFWTVFIVVVLGLVLRLAGIDHGYPFIFHPDEPTAVRSALGVRFFPNPAHFDWPHLYIYVNFVLFMGFSAVRNFFELLGLKDLIISTASIVWDDEFIFYLIARTFSATMGALTIIPVYLTGKELFKDKKVAFFAALTFCLLPFHILHSHYSLIDVPMVFFLAWSLYFCAKILSSPTYTNFWWAGALAGLSASTKYNGALIILVIILSALLTINPTLSLIKEAGSKFMKLCVAAFSSVLFFILGTPFALFDYDTFLRTDGPKGALWQFTNVGKVELNEHISKFVDILTIKLPDDVGYLPLIFYLLGFLYMMWLLVKNRHAASIVVAVLPAIFYITYISGLDKSRSHYMMISYPFIALTTGYVVVLLQYQLNRLIKFNLLWWVVLSTLFVIPLYYSIVVVSRFVKPDTRVELYKYADANIDPQSLIYFESNTFSPVMDKLNNPNKKISFSKITSKSEPGYLFFNFDITEYEIYKKNMNTVINTRNYLERVYEINAQGKNGPYVSIYKIKTN